MTPSAERVDIRVGTITRAEAFPEARKPAYKLWVGFGELGTKPSSAQITENYRLDELVGLQVIAVINFPAKRIGPFLSECLVTGMLDTNGQVVLAKPERVVANGSRLF